ncbi:MAG: helix-turn-helix transcriptional regulator [Roseomonas sp.]|nr:helix-turn-helix transcriptional regulator [Roseomonas sp.]
MGIGRLACPEAKRLRKQSPTRKGKPLTVHGEALTEEVAELEGIVRRLREVRDHMGAQSWAHFSRLMGISIPAIEKWRRGEARPYPSTLAKIADTAKVRREWLEFGAGDMIDAASELAPAKRPRQDRFGIVPAGRPIPSGPFVRAQEDLNLDDLVVAYEGAIRAFAARGQTDPEPRKLLALTLALYDAAVQSLADEAEGGVPDEAERSHSSKADSA